MDLAPNVYSGNPNQPAHTGCLTRSSEYISEMTMLACDTVKRTGLAPERMRKLGLHVGYTVRMFNKGSFSYIEVQRYDARIHTESAPSIQARIQIST